jgi:enoyl-CoA hydratase/carnithine racemase
MSEISAPRREGIAEINLPACWHADAGALARVCDTVNRLLGDVRIRGVVISGDFDAATASGPAQSRFEDLARCLWTAPAPVAAAARGACAGRGFVLLFACHFRVMERGKRIAAPDIDVFERVFGGCLGDRDRELLSPVVTRDASRLVDCRAGPGGSGADARRLLETCIGDKPAPVVRAAMRAIGGGYCLGRDAAFEAEARLFSETAAGGDHD